jgi:hypothetical protein
MLNNISAVFSWRPSGPSGPGSSPRASGPGVGNELETDFKNKLESGIQFAGTVAEHLHTALQHIVAESVRVVHIAPVSRGLHGQMRRFKLLVGTTCNF